MSRNLAQRTFCLIAVTSIACACVFAQAHSTRGKTATQQPAATSWPLLSISVSGNQRYSPAQIIAASGLKAGQSVTKADFDAARDRLVATGAFDNVGTTFTAASNGTGYTARIEVIEDAQMYPPIFEDLPVPEADVRAWLKQKDPLFGPKIAATKESLDRYRKLISDLLESRHLNPDVTSRLTSESAPDLSILFRPSTQRPTVALVRFTNTGEIQPVYLANAAAPTAIGSVYSEALFRQILDHTVRPLYEARGRLNMTYTKITTEKSPDVEGLNVDTEINQGPVYKVAAIKIAGTTMDRDELSRIAKLRTGVIANFDEVRAAETRIEQALRKQGYLRVTSTLRKQLHDNNTADVMLAFDQGPIFTLGKLDIVGLDVTTEPVVRKLWAIEPGKPFNVDYPDYFLKKFKEEGYLDNLKSTDSETNIHMDNHTVDVTLTFKGGGSEHKGHGPDDRKDGERRRQGPP